MESLHLAIKDTKPARPLFRAFQGRFVAQMPALLADNRTPLTFADLIYRSCVVWGDEARAKVDKASPPEEIEAIVDIARNMGNNFYTGTAVLNKDNEYRVVDKHPDLLQVTPKTRLVGGAIPLDNMQWANAADAPGFTLEEAQKAGLQERLSAYRILRHPVWAKTVPVNLLQGYVDLFFNKYDLSKGMAVYLPQPRLKPTLRALCLSSGGSWRALFDGSKIFGTDLARYLIGLDKNIIFETVLGDYT